MERPGRQYSCVKESLTNDLEFIKDGFHVVRSITVVIDTEVERVNTDVLYANLESTSARFNVSIFCNTHFLQIIKFCQISSTLGCISK
jgi:hypothetical protein